MGVIENDLNEDTFIGLELPLTHTPDGYFKRTKTALEQTPPELAADIVERGIVLTGGGALLGELDTTIREATGLPVVIAEDPLTCVVMGTGRCLDEMKSLRNVLIGA